LLLDDIIHRRKVVEKKFPEAGKILPKMEEIEIEDFDRTYRIPDSAAVWYWDRCEEGTPMSFELNEIEFTYSGATEPAFVIPQLSIPRASTTAILGQSGSGNQQFGAIKFAAGGRDLAR